MHEVCEIIMRTYRDTGIVLDPVNILNDVWKKYDLTGLDTYEEIKGLLQTYFKANPVDKRGATPVIIEKEWRGELGGCTFGLMIDYAGIKKKNPKIRILRDYKTDRMPFTVADLQSSLQLRIYQIVLQRHLMPEVEKWIAGYDLFYYGWQQCKAFTEDDLKSAEDYVANVYHQITTDNVWEEKLNNYCGYRECRHTCPTYQKALKNGEVSHIKYVNDANTDWAAIDHEREEMTALGKAAYNRKSELEAMLKYHVEEVTRQGGKVVINGQELMIYSQSQPAFNYDDVYRVLLSANRLDLLNGFVGIKDPKAFMRLCNAQEDSLKLQLLSCMHNGYSSPYITKKRS